MTEPDQGNPLEGDVGMFFDVPFEEYQKWPGLSFHSLRPLVDRTPAHFRWIQDHQEAFDKACYAVGHATHVAVLEPERFDDLYAVQPETYKDAKGKEKPWSGNAKICKAILTALKRSSKTVLTVAQWGLAQRLGDAVLANLDACAMLEQGKAEVSIQWHDEDTGMLLKGRIDLWLPSGGVVDLKTTKCAAPVSFGRDAYRYGYTMQGTMYCDGAKQVAQIDVEPPIFIAVEKAPPYLVCLYQIQDEADVELGRVMYRMALRKVQECTKADKWPGYHAGLNSLLLPPWAGQEIGAD